MGRMLHLTLSGFPEVICLQFLCSVSTHRLTVVMERRVIPTWQNCRELFISTSRVKMEQPFLFLNMLEICTFLHFLVSLLFLKTGVTASLLLTSIIYLKYWFP